ncbi:ArsA-related P-loop ATPase [Thauera linaloolentis]|uniref:ArsA-related P-loop ATPase n=1 Tax=Thauera linaloolentis TaxID=76112 RepID=UPI002480085F|nr:ArsA-related P-loop ATPase [Thauera linaloolentis]
MSHASTRLARYSKEVLAGGGRNLNAGARAMFEEGLRSPGTEETAVFRAFAHTVDEGKDGFVVLDTAPTGHTLLLLHAGAHRNAARSNASPRGRTPSVRPAARGDQALRLGDQSIPACKRHTSPVACPARELRVAFIRRVANEFAQR